jgi:hypothetical protein
MTLISYIIEFNAICDKEITSCFRAHKIFFCLLFLSSEQRFVFKEAGSARRYYNPGGSYVPTVTAVPAHRPSARNSSGTYTAMIKVRF